MDAKAGFSLDRCKSTGKAPPRKDTVPAPSRPVQGPLFVMISMAQHHRLMQITNPTTLQIFQRLQFLAPYGKARGKAFELPDAGAFGFNKDQRSRALTELKKCGLISVKPRPGKSPLIAILHEHKKRVV
jgi:hypothetical protein